MPETTQFKVRAEHLPESARDLQRRKVFFATALGLDCITMLRQYVDHCYDDGLKHELLPESHRIAVKELLALSIWLTLLDQYDGEFPERLKDFFVDCWFVADQLYPEPSSKSIVDEYPAESPADTLCLLASMKIAHGLGLSQLRQDAGIYLGGLLHARGETRAQLLFSSLTEPLEQLEAAIQAYV